MNFESLFVYPNGRTSRDQFVPALLTLLAAIVFYAVLVRGRTGTWSLFILVIPALILLARRLRDMGRTAWLLVVPTALMVTAFAIWLKYASLGPQLDLAVPRMALAVAAGFALWGCIGKGHTEVQ